MFNFNRELSDLILEKAYAHLQVNYSNSTREKINCKCFICGDSTKEFTKKRGWIFFPLGEAPNYHCWNDHCKAVGVDLLAKIQGITYKEAFAQVTNKFRQRDSFSDSDEFIIDDDHLPKIIEQRADIAIQGINIPDDWLPLDDTAKDIIKNRGIMEAPNAPKNWKLYLSKKNKRIVIPWIKDNHIIGYQMRAMYKNQQPKYRFEKGQKKKIFGIDTIDMDHQCVYLMEGVFDAIFVKNGLAIGGIHLTNDQKQLLDNYYFERVYFLDNQWKDPASMKESLKLLEANESVFIWPKNFQAKDVNEHVIKVGTNPFMDVDFLASHTYKGFKGILRLKFHK